MLLLPIAGTAKRTKLNTTTIFSVPPWIALLACHWPFAGRKKTIKTFKQNVAPVNSRDSQEDKIKHDDNFFSAPLDRPLGLSLALRWSQKDNKTFKQNVAPANSKDSQEDKIKHDDIFSVPPCIALLACHWPFAGRKKTIKTFKQNVAPADSRDSQEDKIKHDDNFFSAPLDRPLGLSLALRWSQKDNQNSQAKRCSCQ